MILVDVVKDSITGWNVQVVDSITGELLAHTICGGMPHAGAWAKGARARRDGNKKNPYAGDILGTNGRIALGRRGFSNAWRAGYDAMDLVLK